MELVIRHLGEPAVAGLADGEHHTAVPEYIHTDDGVALLEVQSLNAPRRPAYRAGVVLVKGDAHALLGGKHQLRRAVGELDPCQLVALVKVDGYYAVLADILICVKLGTLDNAVPRDHAEVIIALAEVGNSYH